MTHDKVVKIVEKIVTKMQKSMFKELRENNELTTRDIVDIALSCVVNFGVVTIKTLELATNNNFNTPEAIKTVSQTLSKALMKPENELH